MTTLLDPNFHIVESAEPYSRTIVQDQWQMDLALDCIAGSSHGIWYFDTETTGLSPFTGDRIVGISFLTKHEDRLSSFYLPFRHNHSYDDPLHNLPWTWFYELAPFLANPHRIIIGHNIKFDIHHVEQEGIRVLNIQRDTMIRCHLNNENQFSLELEALAERYTDENARDAEHEMVRQASDLFGRKMSIKSVKSRMADWPIGIVAPYACHDVYLSYRLNEFTEQKLAEQGLLKIAEELDDYGRVVQRMESNGVLVDPEICRASYEDCINHKETLRQKMFAVAGCEFNPGSPKQIQPLLGLTGSTAKDILEEMDHPLAESILEYRRWDRAETAYFGAYLDLLDPTYRIHPNLKVTGTISGRLSCERPNMQAVPKDDERGYKVKNAIKAPNGFQLVSFDYSQIELRVLAFYTQDPSFLRAYQEEGADIHIQTANATGLDRDNAKRLNFSIVYGIGVPGLKKRLGIPELRAMQILDTFHSKYPRVKPLYRSCEQFAANHGYIPLWTGRRRHYGPRDETHKAMSNLIQGAVAEIMRVAHLRLDKIFEGSRVRMILQIHDDTLFEIPTGEVDIWLPVIQQVMQDFDFSHNGDPATRVPIVADCKVGDSWGTMEKRKL